MPHTPSRPTHLGVDVKSHSGTTLYIIFVWRISDEIHRVVSESL
jgi:hypothetical protein